MTKTQKYLSTLVLARFDVIVGGEFERTTNFLGVMKLLVNYTDFFVYTSKEQREVLERLATRGGVVLDMNILVKIK